MKKLISIVLILVFGLALSTVSYAASSNLKISMSSDSSNLKTERKILLNIGLKEFENITTNKPMAAQGTLVYNEQLFKSVTADGKNGWTATLNGKNFVLDAASVTEGKIIVTFTFTLKDDIEIPSSMTFNVNNFSLTNDTEVDYENLTIGEVKVTYTSSENNQNTSEGENEGQGTNNNSSEQQGSNNENESNSENGNTNQGNNQNTGNNSQNEPASDGEVPSNSNVRYEITTEGSQGASNQSQNSNNGSNSGNKIDKVEDLTTSKESKIPQTGETEVLISVIAILAIAGIVIFIRYRSIEIKAR